MMIDNTMYVVLPVVLFLLNIIIVLILRKADSEKHGLTNIRKLTDTYRREVDNKTSTFHSELESIEARLHGMEADTKNLLNQVSDGLNNLKNYDDDMASLRQSIETYRNALAALAKLTSDADSKISKVEGDVSRLEAVEHKINEFQLGIKDAEEYLKNYENSVITLQKDTVSHLEKSMASFKLEADKTLNESKETILLYNSELEQKADVLHKASKELDTSSEKMLGIMGDRVKDQQVLSQQILNLSKNRESLNKALTEINSEIEEKKAFSKQLDSENRTENFRLAKLKETVEKYQNTISMYENRARQIQEVNIEPKSETVVSVKGLNRDEESAGRVNLESVVNRNTVLSGQVAPMSVSQIKYAEKETPNSVENKKDVNVLTPMNTEKSAPEAVYVPNSSVSGGTGSSASQNSSALEKKNLSNSAAEKKETPFMSFSDSFESPYNTTYNAGATGDRFEDYNNQGQKIIINDSQKPKLEYYGKDEEIIF